MPPLVESAHSVAGDSFVCLSIRRTSNPDAAHFPGVGAVRPWPSACVLPEGAVPRVSVGAPHRARIVLGDHLHLRTVERRGRA